MIIANTNNINTYKKNLRNVNIKQDIMFYKDEPDVKEIINDFFDRPTAHIIIEYYIQTFKIDYHIYFNVISFKNDYLNLDIKYTCESSLKPSYLESNILSNIKCYNCILFYNTFVTVFGNIHNQKIKDYIPVKGTTLYYDCRYVGDNTFTVEYIDKIYFIDAFMLCRPVNKIDYIYVRDIDEMKIIVEILKILIETTLFVIN
jgi:hypothetical protein